MTHNEKMTVAAMKMALMKVWAQRSYRVAMRRQSLMAAFEEERDQTLVELCGRLAARGIAASKSALSRFFQRRGITRKNVWPAPSAS